MRIVLAGPKGCGKSTIERLLSERLDIPAYGTDEQLEALYKDTTGKDLRCREIFKEVGEEEFRRLEVQAVSSMADYDWCVISTGGSTMLDCDSRRILRNNSILVYIYASVDTLWKRFSRSGIPPFLEGPDGRKKFSDKVSLLSEVLSPFADIKLDSTGLSPEKTVQKIIGLVEEELLCRSTSPSSLGHIFRVATFGESHGPTIGCVLDGVPSQIPISHEDIQKELDRRKPGQSDVTTPRKESDTVRILSGVFEGQTTGAPICLMIENRDQRSHNYEGIKNVFRPGHADFTFWKKFGLRDYRGGGRSSGRETAARVAGGAVARKLLLQNGVKITGHAIEIARIKTEKTDYDEIERNPVRTADKDAAKMMMEAITSAREKGESVGGVVRLEIDGLPAGLGDPVFEKLDARLAQALFSLGAVKAVEIGAGSNAPEKMGSENNDEMRDMRFVTNNAGGIAGGISTGEKIEITVHVKPTPSVSVKQQTCNESGENIEIEIEGRHDPCIVPRVIPAMEAMVSIVLQDAWMVQERLRPGWPENAD